jgi:pyruvate dehydrogenase E1 component beta subunit
MMRTITYCEALKEATAYILEKHSNAFLYGIGVPDHTEIFGSVKGIYEQYGDRRCFDVPLCEDTLAGFGLGAALGGLTPIFINIRVDFLLLALNQLANMISSYQYMMNGSYPLPFVIRAVIGRGWGQGCQHSKSCQSIFAHIPGLKVVMPTTPSDAKGLLISACEDMNPVVFIEHRWLYWQEEEVQEGPFRSTIGEGRVLRKGKDVTIVATSWMNVETLKAADILRRKAGVDVEIVDPRTIYPLDEQIIYESVNKTHNCIVADNDWTFCGFSSEVAALVSDNCFPSLENPVKRVGFKHTPCPTARHLENEFYPNSIEIIQCVQELLDLGSIDLLDEEFYSNENRFKGPF